MAIKTQWRLSALNFPLHGPLNEALNEERRRIAQPAGIKAINLSLSSSSSSYVALYYLDFSFGFTLKSTQGKALHS